MPDLSLNNFEILERLKHDLKKPYSATMTFFDLLKLGKTDKEFIEKSEESIQKAYESILEEIDKLT